MALPRKETATLVQRLFADATVLKLGFALQSDFWAVSQVLIAAEIGTFVLDEFSSEMILTSTGCNSHWNLLDRNDVISALHCRGLAWRR